MDIHILYFVAGDGFTYSADAHIAYYLDGEKAEIVQISLNDKIKFFSEEMKILKEKLKKKRDADWRDWTPYHDLRTKYNAELFDYALKEFELDLKEKGYNDFISCGDFNIDIQPIVQ